MKSITNIENKKNNIANYITLLRIIFSIILLFCKTFSPMFYCLYLIAGFTDMIDGTIARKTNSVSEFGSKLDTTADFILILICFIKIFPILIIPIFIYIWIIIIALIKVINAVSGYIMHKKFMAVHSIMNKVTGFLLFIFPLTLEVIDIKYSGIIICILATFSAIHEGYNINYYL